MQAQSRSLEGMMRSNDVAAWLLRHEQARGERPSITNMKLQKLVYLAESGFGSLYGEDLVVDPFQAWDHGPAVKPLYGLYKSFGREPITSVAGCPQSAPDDVSEVLETVWDHFGHLSAADLRRLTHDVGPYDRHYRKGVQDILLPKPEIHGSWDLFLVEAGKRRLSVSDRAALKALDAQLANVTTPDEPFSTAQLMADHRLFSPA